MKLRRSMRLHNLKRQRVRQSWNKYNLYNLAKLRPIEKTIVANRTFFQQKWYAKAQTRAYHGEHIREGQWERMFSRRFASAVNMNPRYMARFDGSEQAEGRGSGKDFKGPPDSTNERSRAPTPYMQMTFAPMERRLDIAVFRAMFASSARQARQFVIHGRVTVNGKKMAFPGYLLNPGDMFQVDPDMVMMAAGKPKGNLTALQKKQGKKGPHTPKEEEAAEEAPAEEEAEAASKTATSSEALEEPDPESKANAEASAIKQRGKELKSLLGDAKAIISMDKELGVKRKQKIRAFMLDLKKAISKASQKTTTSSDIPVEEMTAMLDKLSVATSEAAATNPVSTKLEDSNFSKDTSSATLSPAERQRFDALLKEYRENPIDESKPYRTPWEPRPFLAPFAFIPRYLEVNQKVCSAVYLRHPVARQGESEVPTPFPEFIGQLSFNWYLRRR